MTMVTELEKCDCDQRGWVVSCDNIRSDPQQHCIMLEGLLPTVLALGLKSLEKYAYSLPSL